MNDEPCTCMKMPDWQDTAGEVLRATYATYMMNCTARLICNRGARDIAARLMSIMIGKFGLEEFDELVRSAKADHMAKPPPRTPSSEGRSEV